MNQSSNKNKMIKRFLEWIKIKSETHDVKLLPSFQEGEIWWVNLGENVGHEEDGKGNLFLRPFVIIRKFNKELLFGVPCSSIYKDNKYYFKIDAETDNFHSSALLSQGRVLSSRRLKRFVTKLGSGAFRKLKTALLETVFS